MDVRNAVRRSILKGETDLWDLSRRIHSAPELAFEEERAAAWVAEALNNAGFSVVQGAGGLSTAVVARAGSGPLHVAFLAEYDALPGIGHACGHNLIAASAVGAALGAASVADDAGLTVSLIGTPAEEDGGGKALLLQRGVFDDVHAALMAHPGPVDADPVPFLALAQLDVRYHGKAAHASAFPERGVNAADALTVAQVGIGLLRQHLGPAARVSGITTCGGEAANVVPAETVATYEVRARTIADLADVRRRVERCFEAGALATGATVEITDHGPAYADVRHDADLSMLYRRNAMALGRRLVPAELASERFSGSTDLGNVSHVLPAIHPLIGIDSLPAVNHQPEFAAHCVSPAAARALVDAAVALAWTAIDAATDPALASRLSTSRSG